MNDRYDDSSSITSKPHSKLTDSQSKNDLSGDNVRNQSLSDSSRSMMITDKAQHLSLITVQTNIIDISSTNRNHTLVSTREDQHGHAILPSSLSETDNLPKSLTTMTQELSNIDLVETTQDITQLSHVGEDKKPPTETHLNPNAPDFIPAIAKSTYHSELTPKYVERRKTHVDPPTSTRHSRTRYYSDTYHYPESLTSTDTSTLRPLLSITPQYLPYDQQSTSAITLLLPSKNSSRLYETTNVSNLISSYNSRPTVHCYTSLIHQQTPSSSNVNYFHNQHKNKHSSKRIRTYSGRTSSNPNSSKTFHRQRSYSDADTSLELSSGHLNGIHSLTRIMVDILRNINQVAEKQKQESMASTNTVPQSLLIENNSKMPEDDRDEKLIEKEAQSQNSIEAKNCLIDSSMSTNASKLLPLSIDETAGIFMLISLFLPQLLKLNVKENRIVIKNRKKTSV